MGRCGELDWIGLIVLRKVLVWELCEQSDECRKLLDWWSFPRQSAARVSVTDLKGLVLAVCRYQMVVATVWWGVKHISKENVHSETVVWHCITVFGLCMIIVSANCK